MSAISPTIDHIEIFRLDPADPENPLLLASVTEGAGDLLISIDAGDSIVFFPQLGSGKSPLPTNHFLIWDFGDGSVSNEIYPEKQYLESGICRCKVSCAAIKEDEDDEEESEGSWNGGLAEVDQLEFSLFEFTIDLQINGSLPPPPIGGQMELKMLVPPKNGGLAILALEMNSSGEEADVVSLNFSAGYPLMLHSDQNVLAPFSKGAISWDDKSPADSMSSMLGDPGLSISMDSSFLDFGFHKTAIIVLDVGEIDIESFNGNIPTISCILDYQLHGSTSGLSAPQQLIEEIPILFAWDPNEVYVDPPCISPYGSWMKYSVFFENVGPGIAKEVMIEMELHEYLDLDSFVDMGAKALAPASARRPPNPMVRLKSLKQPYPIIWLEWIRNIFYPRRQFIGPVYTVEISKGNRKVKWMMKTVHKHRHHMLGPGHGGYVDFMIKSNAGLPLEAKFENVAVITFEDANPYFKINLPPMETEPFTVRVHNHTNKTDGQAHVRCIGSRRDPRRRLVPPRVVDPAGGDQGRLNKQKREIRKVLRALIRSVRRMGR